jgi:hypothetical protein
MSELITTMCAAWMACSRSTLVSSAAIRCAWLMGALPGLGGVGASSVTGAGRPPRVSSPRLFFIGGAASSPAGSDVGRAFSLGPLRPALSRIARQAGASVQSGGAGRVQAGVGRGLVAHGLTFVPLRLVHQLVQGLFFPIGRHPVESQLSLPLLGRIDAPAAIPGAQLRCATTYREAVRLCWSLRRAKGLTASDLAREFGFNRQHVSDYLNADDAATRRNLPGDMVQIFEEVCGNTAISQWHAARARLTVLEELQAERAAA